MAITKLQVWNKALRLLGFDRLSALTDNVGTRYELTDVWNVAPIEVLEAGHWNFATITEASSGTTTSPIPGYTHRHSLPPDWVRTIQISTSADFSTQADHRTEAGYIYAQTATLYLRYLSSDKAGDSGVADWPPSFADAVSLRMALSMAPILRPGEGDRIAYLWELYADQLRRAAQADAWSRHVQHKPPNEALLFPMGERTAPSAQAGGGR